MVFTSVRPKAFILGYRDLKPRRGPPQEKQRVRVSFHGEETKGDRSGPSSTSGGRDSNSNSDDGDKKSTKLRLTLPNLPLWILIVLPVGEIRFACCLGIVGVVDKPHHRDTEADSSRVPTARTSTSNHRMREMGKSSGGLVPSKNPKLRSELRQFLSFIVHIPFNFPQSHTYIPPSASFILPWTRKIEKKRKEKKTLIRHLLSTPVSPTGIWKIWSYSAAAPAPAAPSLTLTSSMKSPPHPVPHRS